MNLSLSPRRTGLLAAPLLLALLLTGTLLLALAARTGRAAPAAPGDLTVNIVAGYNLVVDSNVESPSTYAPSVATVMGEFCNSGSTPLSSAYGYIGDASAGTPGLYPARDATSSAFRDEHPALDNGGSYAFTHVGGQLGLADASRYLGTLEPGECKVQYWHFSYPQCENNQDGSADYPACEPGNNPTWGDSVKPEDDLWLSFDVWGKASDGGTTLTAAESWTMTMRNEISAMANKIKPNPDGRWFNTDDTTVRPGDVITSNGILYELGNVNKGFDNDGDYAYDYNAWLQPIGDPSFDPTCFRLIRTTGVLTVARGGGNPDTIIPFTDQLYHTNLPQDNTGVRGEIFYTFLALDGPCSAMLTPYQEVASGADNEKFNGDFGVSLPPVESSEATLVLDKYGDVTSVPTDGTGEIAYTIDFQNPETDTSKRGLGLPLYNMPLVLRDEIPAGTSYVAGSAAYNLSYAGSVDILYSTDGGTTWTAVEPPAASVTTIQWQLNEPLPSDQSGSATFRVLVDNGYDPPGTEHDAFVENCADGRFGDGVSFKEACERTLVEGPNSIGDFVWQDENGNGAFDGDDTPLANIGLSLIWDANGDGQVDGGDLPLATTTSAGDGSYLFDRLPDGDFLVQVERDDPDRPAGYGLTTPALFSVGDLGVGSASAAAYLDADFGFGPSLQVVKSLTSAAPAYEGREVTYTIDVNNLLPGDGSGQATACTYEVWATQEEIAHYGGGATNSSWTNATNIFNPGEPDGLYAYSDYSDNSNQLGGTGFGIGDRGGTITQVEALFALYVGGTLADDYASTSLYFNDALLAEPTHAPATLNAFGPTAAGAGVLAWDVSGLRSWTWSDFAGNLDLQIETLKNGSKDGVNVYLDAMGFRVTTDASCGGPDDTLNPVPLTDSYDPAKLAFVGANPAPTTSSSGTLYWANVGPIYAGGTATVDVTFLALEPAGNLPTTITNTATVANATFVSGEPANDGEDDAVTTLEPTAAIGDLVWNDNGSVAGSYEPALESGIPGVTVELWSDADGDGQIESGDALMATQVTDTGGNYLFPGLTADDYVVVVDPATLPGSTASQSADPDGTLDNQSTTTIGGTGDDLTRDFGYTIPNTVFGNIWHDYDGDSLQDPGDDALAGVTVELQDGACTPGVDCPTATTDADGNYRFSDLSDGSYRVVVDTTTLPAGGSWSQTYDPDASVDDQTDVFALSGGTIAGSFDFAYTQSGSAAIGDTLYLDWDGDGVRYDATETGIPAVTVTLYADGDSDGVLDPAVDALVATTVSAADGSYLFDTLPAGNWIVVVDESDPDFPAGVYQTQDGNEAAPCTVCDSQDDVTTGATGLIDTIDFGYRPVGSAAVGDFVWVDEDGDGVQDAGEVGLPDAEILLIRDNDGDGEAVPWNDALVDWAVTDADGNYLFEQLPAGDYVVIFEYPNYLPDDAYGNPYVPSTPLEHAITLAGGERYLDADFGVTAGGVVGDLLWQDDDGDGSPGIMEPGIGGVTVNLYRDENGNGRHDGGEMLEASTTTDAGGFYQFTGLWSDNYVVVVDETTLPAGFNQTGDPDANGSCNDADGAAYNDCDGSSGLTLAPGQIDRTRDFGYRPQGIVGDFIWLDGNGDGVQDAGEKGIAGVEVTLLLGTGGSRTTTTSFDGSYFFGDVPDGTHTITVNTTTLPAQWPLAQSGDPDGSLDNSGTVTLSGGGSDLTMDFGYRLDGAYSIGGTAFLDMANDGGDYLPGEPVYSGMPIYLWQNGQLLAGATTDANGNYLFANLPAGDYVVSTSDQWPGLYDAVHSTTDVNDGTVYEYVTIVDQDVSDVDFGFYGELDPTAVSLANVNTAQPGATAGLLLVLLLLLGLVTAGLRLARRS